MFVFVRICSFLKDVRVFSHTNKNTPPESFHSSHSINRPFLLKQEARRDIFKKVLEKYQLKLLNDECSNASWILDIVYPDYFANSPYTNLYTQQSCQTNTSYMELPANQISRPRAPANHRATSRYQFEISSQDNIHVLWYIQYTGRSYFDPFNRVVM